MGEKGIVLEVNDWEDCEWWYEDEPEVFKFMRANKDMIVKYSLENGMNFRDGIKYLFKIGD